MTKAVWASGAVEFRDDGGALSQRVPPATEHRTSAWFCWGAVAAQLLGGLLAWACYVSGRVSSTATLSLGFGVAAGLAITSALVLHQWRSHERRTKYGALLAGQGWLSCALVLGYASLAPTLPMMMVGATLLLSLLPLSWLVHAALRVNRNVEEDAASFRRALGVYRFTRLAGPGIGWRSLLAFCAARLLDPTGYVFLLARYLATEKLLRARVLYLRAFQAPQSEPLTAALVTPLTARMPIEAWVHDSAQARALAGQARAGLLVRPIRVDDADWQLWLERQLGRSLAVIVDGSRESSTLSYELKLALQLVPRSRIIVLLPDGMREPRSGLGTITFDADSPAQAEKPLAAWLELATDTACSKSS